MSVIIIIANDLDKNINLQCDKNVTVYKCLLPWTVSNKKRKI